MTKGNGKNGTNGGRDPFGPARRQREYRKRKKMKKECAAAIQEKNTYHIHADGSCTQTFGSTTFNYSPQQWTFYCKCMALLGMGPRVIQIESQSGKPKLTLSLPEGPIPLGYGDKRWLKFCENDPNRDQVQIDIIK